MDQDALRKSISKLQPRSTAARLRELMPEIDRKARSGVQCADIVAALTEGGLKVSLKTLRQYLYRWRAAARKARGAPAPDLSKTPAGSAKFTDEPPALHEAARFEAALDPKRRGDFAEKYLERRRPLIGKGRSNQQ